jgi:hypothetical protein
MHGKGVPGVTGLCPDRRCVEDGSAEQHGAPGRGSTEGTTEGKKLGHGDNATRRLEIMTSIPMNGAG